MATTPITKTASPANSVGLVIHTEEEAFFDNSPWTAVPAGANNGVTFSFNVRDLVLLGNSINNATRTFTFLTPEPAGLSDYGVTVLNPTLVVASQNTVVALRLSELFKGSGNLVTIEANATGGYCAVISPP